MVFEFEQAWPRWIAGLLTPRDGGSNPLPRATKEGMGSHQIRLLLYFAQLGRCCWCGEMMQFVRTRTNQPGRDFPTFEHLVRKQDGGKFFCDNILLAHRKCNTSREIERQKEENAMKKLFR